MQGNVLKIFSEREYSGSTRVRASEVCQGLPTPERGKGRSDSKYFEKSKIGRRVSFNDGRSTSDY